MLKKLPLVLIACADVTPPEDGLDLGGVIQVKDWFTSAYLVTAPDAVVLFDAGFRPSRMEAALAGYDLTPDDVTDVVLTHGHGDHVGALSLYGSATVWSLEAERELVVEEAGRAPDATLEGPELLELADLQVEVFPVRGHTEGSAVYLVEGVLILGDTSLQSKSGELIPVAEKRSDDPEQAVTSLRTLATELAERSEDVRWLAPSHSAPIEGFEALAAF